MDWNRIIIIVLLVLFNCSSMQFIESKYDIVSVRYEFENMAVILGPAVLPSSEAMDFWSWGTTELDLSDSNIKDSVTIRLRLREDHAGQDFARFVIEYPTKNQIYTDEILVTDTTFQIYEKSYINIIPGKWFFSFMNDYPQSDSFPKGRNLFADYVEFSFDSSIVIQDTIKTDTLWCSDLSLPKKVIVSWDKNQEPDVDRYVVFKDTLPFINPIGLDSLVTVDTFAIDSNLYWLDFYVGAIAIDTADNRSDLSDLLHVLILQSIAQHKGDWNNDGKVHFEDLLQLMKRNVYGSKESDPCCYTVIFDFDEMGEIKKIDFRDLVAFMEIYGTIFDDYIIKIP